MPTEEPGGGNTGTGGGNSSGTGGTGGSKPSGSGGTPSGSGGSTPSGSGGSTPSGSGGSPAGSGGSGPTGTGGGGTPDASTGGDTPPVVSTGPMPTCTTEPAAAAPALKKTLVARITGDQAGQVIGVPGEAGIYILGHRTGKIYYAIDGKVDPTPMASIAVKSNAPQDEQGMLGIAFHPKFAENKLFYVVYTAPNANIRIDELERTSPTSSKPTRTIWDKTRAGGGAYHNGGQIWFNAKDGADKPILYHAVGNTSAIGSGRTPEGNFGRVLAHDLSGAAVTSKTVSFGLRNPYRMTIDRATGDMYIGEIDDPALGAIYISPAGTAPGKDWGYTGGGVKAGVTGKEGPRAVIGGMVYRGTKITGLCGRYFYATWPGGAIKSFIAKGGTLMGGATAHANLGTGGIASFGEDGQGELYYATQSGEVYKIEAM